MIIVRNDVKIKILIVNFIYFDFLLRVLENLLCFFKVKLKFKGYEV